MLQSNNKIKKNKIKEAGLAYNSIHLPLIYSSMSRFLNLFTEYVFPCLQRDGEKHVLYMIYFFKFYFSHYQCNMLKMRFGIFYIFI